MQMILVHFSLDGHQTFIGRIVTSSGNIEKAPALKIDKHTCEKKVNFVLKM